MIKILKNKNIIVIWLIILFALPLITHSIIGKNFHYMADDFGNANMLKEYGFLGAINYWFVNWSGQISGLILTNLFCIITPSDFYGPWTLILILLITQQYGLSKLISIKEGRTSLLYVLLVSLALLNVSMDLLPTLRRVEYPYYFPPGGSPSFVVSSVYQTFYWQLQAQQMILPLSIMWIIIGLIIYIISNRNTGSNNYGVKTIILLLTLFIAGIRPTLNSIMLFVIAIIILLMIYENYHEKYKGVYLMLWLMIGVTLLALIIMVKAPGTNARMTYFKQPTSVEEFFKIVYNGEKYFFYNILKWPGNIISILQLVLISIFVGYLNTKNAPNDGIKSLDKIKFISFVLIMYLFSIPFVSISPAVIATSKMLASRVQFYPIYFLVLGLGIWGYYIGRYSSEKISNWSFKYPKFSKSIFTLIILLISFDNLRDSKKIYQAGHRVTDYYNLLEKRDVLIKSAISSGKKKISVPEKKDFYGVGGLSSDSSHWINQVWSTYYGINITSE